MTQSRIALATAEPADFPVFKRELQAAFAVAVTDHPGGLPDGPIPSDEDLDQAMAASGAIVLHVLRDGRKVGGAVVRIDHATQANSLDLFFIAVGHHDQGLGKKAWFAIEEMFPGTRSWQTMTPYFEKRNIHFYVNVCKFHIVEYYNERHPDPHQSGSTDALDDDGMFRFMKTMKPDR